MLSNPQNEQDFGTLSLRDLIEARDLYHFHLINKSKVIGTAIGLYLIRNEEKWPHENGGAVKLTYPRTFGNSQVREYSWPCIIVLVRDWVKKEEFGKVDGAELTDVIPKRLFLPDGRSVPVCVVWAPPMPQSETRPRPPVVRPNETFGGGLPIFVNVQKQSHIATVGCLVSDGQITYALTARHACGEPGTELSVMLRGGLKRIGVGTDKQITRKVFSEVYPALPLRQTWLNLDVGLVRIDDVRAWTPNTYGLPPIKPLFDIYEQNMSLRRLMDQPVVAVGASSGPMHGTIKALFYRYRSVGGFDYVSDFLIAPADGEPGARHGDSGALWYLQMPGPDAKPDARPLSKRDLRPLAVEWGSQIFADRGERTTFSVATSLSNVCKLLDVELVVEGAETVSGTWGAVGHYTIGALAIEQVKDATLKAFLQANADRISLEVDAITGDLKNSDLLDSELVPLADVPDIVWKNFPSPHLNSHGEDIGVTGGRDNQSGGVRSTGPEHPTHHCDADRPFANHNTLPEACIANPDLITAAKWNEYFDAFPEPVNELHRGILPFRVWQFFERMKDYAADEPAKFIAAAGILAHYVGDASQPLHGSTMSDGIEDEEPDAPRDSQRKDKHGNKLPAFRGEGVHSAYETQMVNSAMKKGKLIPEISNNLGADHALALAQNGKEAAKATLVLMHAVAQILPPRDIIDAYETSFVDQTSHTTALWEATGPQTGQVMALGIRTLAMLWDAAWAAGGGHTNAGQQTKAELRELYEDTHFVRSVAVNGIEHEIAHPSPLH
jgi:hypothetical protein